MTEWKEYKLGDVINFKRGYDLPNSKRKIGKYPIISSSGITDYHIDYMKEAPGVVTGRYGTIGKVFYTEKPYWPLNTTLYVTDFKGNDPKFIFYFLQSFDFEKFSDKSTVPGINRNHLHTEEVTIPSLPEQKSIASILSSLDDKIDLLHRQNTTLEKMAETLFRQWFVEEAKEEWEEIELGSVVETTSGGTPSRTNMGFYENGTISWVKSKELNGSFILDTEEKITEEALKKSSAKILPAHSVLIAMYGATVGEYAIISKEMTCNQAICALKPNKDYPYSYLFLFIKSNKEELINMAVGSAQQNISQLLIKQLPVLNCTGLIKEFNLVVEPYFEKIKSNQTQIRTLTAMRDTLLPKLMSGEIIVEKY